MAGRQNTESTASAKTRETPTGYLSRARAYLKAAAALEPNRGAAVPAHMPVSHEELGRALELSLKAFLLAKGQDRDRLRSYGHRLNALTQAAQKEGLGDYVTLTPKHLEAIRGLAPYYTSRELQYHGEGAALKTLPPLAPLFSAAEALRVGLRRVCLEATNKLMQEREK